MSPSTPEAASAPNESNLPAPGRYVIDSTHSAISLTIRHLVAAKVRGRFTEFSGEINVTEDRLASTTNVSISVASIDTGVGDRDDHLRSGDFFDVGGIDLAGPIDQRRRAAYFAGQRHAIGRAQCFAGHAGLAVGGQKSIDDGIRNTVADFVGMPLRDRFTGKKII